ncbi:DUF7529 family protein [Halorussus halobius]|uniref:DUF7529 family protein n=1 Tax=Halorussus halobius TaxID=1710537 RepID=UPI001092FF80|nr:hypothetical protein [Halorussus halobius]
MTEDPLTTAWNRFRDALDERERAYEREGYDVTTATADHGSATRRGATGRLAFTVPDDRATALESAADGGSFPRTRIEYVDVDGHRLLSLASLDPETETALLVAGGVERDALASFATDEVDAVETVVRRIDGTHAVVLRHDDPDPFVDGLDDAT